MSKRRRRRQEKARRHGRKALSKRQIAAGAGLTVGATLAAAGTAHGATFTVSNLNDSGPGSLRQAILDANQNGNGSTVDDIVFPSGLSGTIDLGSTSGLGLYARSPMNIQGPGPGLVSLRGTPSVDYLVFVAYSVAYGSTPADPVTISGLTLTGGSADSSVSSSDGGGIFHHNMKLTVASSVITGNSADDDGGGIYAGGGPNADQGSLTVLNSTISNNAAGVGNNDASYGGAIMSGDSPVAIINSTLSGNTAGGDGGGVYMSSGSPGPSLRIENSTIANNTALAPGTDDEGGGVWICCGSNGQQRLDIESSTITGNSVGGNPQGQGGGVYAALDYPNEVAINNTIVANNSSTGPGTDVYSIEGLGIGFSLVEAPIGTDTDADVEPVNSTGPNILGVDPQLGALASNGGPTQTQALAATSPAVDAGNTTLTTDQRGSTRPFDFASRANAAGGNGADIGAFELAPNCQGRAATIVARPGQTTLGTAGADVIVGTDARDVIRAGKGADRVCARAGNDKVAGGKGKDRLNGDAGKDRIGGGGGKDTAKGGKGKDRLAGAAGNDKLVGGKAADRLKGGKGNDKLKGGPGRDKLIGGPGTDRLSGGAGKDVQKQ